MPKKSKFAVGFIFHMENGDGGVVISPNEALIIKGEGGRTGYTREKGPIPEFALPGYSGKFEVNFALESVSIVLT